MRKKQEKLIREVLQDIIQMDNLYSDIVISCLKLGEKKKLEYNHFNLRKDLIYPISDKYCILPLTIEKNLSRVISDNWTADKLEPLGEILGVKSRPTIKVLMSILLEKLFKKEI